MDAEEARAEYEHAQHDLELPDGMEFPDEYPPASDEPTRYEEGHGQGFAESFYICAWQREWLDVYAEDEDAAREALAMLHEARDTRFMREQLDDAGRELYDEYLSQAELGDPSGIRHDVELNCTGRLSPE
ncbi:hypothetical protein [Haloechinothrix sp. LS1_15]|uniref:hypothetical protein n=1 Tax=Haloechinothrix sp. LS1_15 TaxID=2652248 RepID=UPI002947D75E|nr:hypothetical protein [Haloechinothrix sp. LS1_15]MDV6013227.1 hypothetical protein [Haloechinothrix sp. LS1_15]